MSRSTPTPAQRRAKLANRSLILITHDLQQCDVVDEVLVVDAGRVVQRGGATELRTVDGPYRRLLVS